MGVGKVGVRAKGAACVGCPAFQLGKGFVLPTEPTSGRNGLVLIGSGPSSDEFLDGSPFTGFVGQRLEAWLSRAGLERSQLALGHVVQCQLPYERGAPREPKAPEVEWCRKAHWEPWLARVQPRVVVPVGIGATKAFLGRQAKANDIGNLHLVGNWLVLPIQSPSYILGGNWAEEPAQVEYLKYAKELTNGLEHSRPDFSQPPPGVAFIYQPTLTDLHKFQANIGPGGVVVDIETAGDHLRLVGLLARDNLDYLGFPLRSQGGAGYWSQSDLPAAVQWLWELLADPNVPKTFHNGSSFDVPMLERNGFVVSGYVFDTMLAAHVAYPGVPKGLEELTKVHLRAGGWKSLVKMDAETGEAK